VPQQGGDVVNILSQDNIMDTVADISIPDAHGKSISILLIKSLKFTILNYYQV